MHLKSAPNLMSQSLYQIQKFFANILAMICALFVGAIQAQPASNSSSPSVEFLLSQLSQAVQTQNYRGVFTYEYSGKLETFSIEHLVKDGVVQETLYRTTGADQSFSREGPAACGTIGGNLLSGMQLTSSKGGRFGLKHYYRFRLMGNDRVANRDAWVIQLLPADEFRYGLSFSIDKSSYLLLRYLVFDAQKNTALERVQYASLETKFDESLQLQDESDSRFVSQEVAHRNCVGKQYTPSSDSPWKPTWLPPGFILMGYQYSESEGHMESYTDGLSSFSIFVNDVGPRKSGSQQVQQGVSSKGAVTAMLSTIPYRDSLLSVSVVGEIPPRVSQRITLSLAQVRKDEGSVNDD